MPDESEFIPRQQVEPANEATRLAALDASWRATMARERGVHLNEVRLKEAYRNRAIAAEAELAKIRGSHDANRG